MASISLPLSCELRISEMLQTFFGREKAPQNEKIIIISVVVVVVVVVEISELSTTCKRAHRDAQVSSWSESSLFLRGQVNHFAASSGSK